MMKYTGFFLFLVLAAFVPGLAYAYIGPGLGVVAVWALLGPIAAIVVTVLLIAYFPARYYYKKRKNKDKAGQEGEAKDDDGESDDSAS